MSVDKYFYKRCFDILFAFFGIIFFFGIILICWVIASIDCRKNGFFIQKRIGMNGKIFKIIKIRTMRENLSISTTITTINDPRITRIGKFFRKTKIDELPQLWNVLVGEMSFVGPRPDVPGYADKLEGKNKQILLMRPGITGPAQLFFKKEESILAQHKDAKVYNDEVIWPKKVKMNLDYVINYSFLKDFHYIWKTLVK